jgi:hypothetical protein
MCTVDLSSQYNTTTYVTPTSIRLCFWSDTWLNLGKGSSVALCLCLYDRTWYTWSDNKVRELYCPPTYEPRFWSWVLVFFVRLDLMWNLFFVECSVLIYRGFVMFLCYVPWVDLVSVVIGGSDTRFDTNLDVWRLWNSVWFMESKYTDSGLGR